MSDIFTVRHRSMLLKVQLLASVEKVHRAYSSDSDAPRLAANKQVLGFFQASDDAQCVGTIVLPMRGGNLLEIVPHEVAHAVIHHLNGVLSHDDEPCSYAIGILCARIFEKLKKMGVMP